MSAEPEYRPRLNHVAIAMDPAVLDDAGRAEILDFYGDVFGWTEGDNTGEHGNPLILYTGEFGQFIFLLPAEGAATGQRRSITSVSRSRRVKRSRTSWIARRSAR